MTELATRNLISGTARLMSAVIVLMELVVGVALGEQLASALARQIISSQLPRLTVCAELAGIFR